MSKFCFSCYHINGNNNEADVVERVTYVWGSKVRKNNSIRKIMASYVLQEYVFYHMHFKIIISLTK